jgi:hypothetical protein
MDRFIAETYLAGSVRVEDIGRVYACIRWREYDDIVGNGSEGVE